MDKTRLKLLKKRADKAVELADMIQRLSDCDPSIVTFTASFTDWNTGNSFLDDALLKLVLIAGRKAVLQQCEQDLEECLSEPSPMPDARHGGTCG